MPNMVALEGDGGVECQNSTPASASGPNKIQNSTTTRS